MTDGAGAGVPNAARALGYAGLLPQAAAVAMVIAGRGADGTTAVIAAFGAGTALIYGAVILSFLGGIWWGFAMRAGHGGLAAAAVVPSLVAALVVMAGFSGMGRGGWALVALGSAILLTLPVDRALERSGIAPAGWMRLRVPLSVGLGVLTIAAGILAPG